MLLDVYMSDKQDTREMLVSGNVFKTMLRVIFGAYISYGVLILSITFFQAIGKAGGASILALARQLVLFLPLVVILPHLGGLGVSGVFYAQLITDLVVLLLAIILLLKAFAGFKKN